MPSQSEPATGSASANRRNLISLASVVLFFAFFLPWVQILGANLSGLDIQKNFTSYRLIWLMPALAVVTLGLNIAGQNTGLIRRMAGLVPAIILGYGLNQLGTDLFKTISWGGWLALVSGIVLICLPSPPKPSTEV